MARMGGRRGAYRVLVGRPEGKRPTARPKRRWKNIKNGCSEKRDGEAWIGLLWLRIGKGGGRL